MSSPTPGGVDAELVAALQAALAAEHAAVWAYGLATAFLPAQRAAALAEGAAAHRSRRDVTERTLTAVRVAPVPAEPGYLPPEPVTGAAGALALLVVVESDGAAAWRYVVQQGSGELRTSALDALVGSAVRAARWRAAAATGPLTVPFPGAP